MKKTKKLEKLQDNLFRTDLVIGGDWKPVSINHPHTTLCQSYVLSSLPDVDDCGPAF